jgi:hypothetical protein
VPDLFVTLLQTPQVHKVAYVAFAGMYYPSAYQRSIMSQQSTVTRARRLQR